MWPKTTLLPVWPKDAKSLDTPESRGWGGPSALLVLVAPLAANLFLLPVQAGGQVLKYL